MAAVTFLFVGPFEENQGDLAEVLPPLLSFATTQCELDPRRKFSPRPAAATGTEDEADTLEDEEDRPARAFRFPPLSGSGSSGYRRLEPTQSATEVLPLTRMNGASADGGNDIDEGEEEEGANDTFSLTNSQMRRFAQLH